MAATPTPSTMAASTHHVQHLLSDSSFDRPLIFTNPHHTPSSSQWQSHATDPAVEAFHRALPDYAETTLHALPSLAADLHLRAVFLKDESTRFGLPAFKILGASWAVHRALCARLGLPPATALPALRDALSNANPPFRVVTCTEGNWGRATARMGRYLGVSVTVYVPGFMSAYTQRSVREEGAEVVVLRDGSYDDCIAATREDEARTGALMVMDTAWEGYEEIPQWVTDGYTTMLTETDRQIASSAPGLTPNTFFVSVGVGSWAHAVVAHYKSSRPSSAIIAVEPLAAPSLKESLHCNALTPVVTGHTIMAGMCCGTTSALAWPVLREGVSSAVVVSDREAHEAVVELKEKGVNAGPCGAATLAALRRYVEGIEESRRGEMVVVLFSTEGWREYEVPEK